MSDDLPICELSRAISECDVGLARRAAGDAIAAGYSADRIMGGLCKGMESLCERFNEGTVFLPQLVLASKAMDAAVSEIEGAFGDSERTYRGVVVMGTVRGDIHEIGKNICVAMLRTAGYKVVDIGYDNGPEDFIAAARRNGAEIISASSLMTTTLRAQKDLVETNNACGKLFKCILGGAPCTREWCDSIGADGYSSSADGIVELVGRLIPDMQVAIRKTCYDGSQRRGSVRKTWRNRISAVPVRPPIDAIYSIRAFIFI